MALVISGQVRHRHMSADKIEKALRNHIPGLLISFPEFSASRSKCKVDFFCNTSSTLDFSVTITATSTATPAAITLLIREAEALIATLIRALSRVFGKAELYYCYLEDQRSRSILLTWGKDAPLTSPPAKLSYAICVMLLVLGAFLVYGLLQQPQNDARDYNILSLMLAIGLPALTLPLPFIFEHMRSRHTNRWLFGVKGGA